MGSWHDDAIPQYMVARFMMARPVADLVEAHKYIEADKS
jgi:hypothetical protein